MARIGFACDHCGRIRLGHGPVGFYVNDDGEEEELCADCHDELNCEAEENPLVKSDS